VARKFGARKFGELPRTALLFACSTSLNVECFDLPADLEITIDNEKTLYCIT
jgi:hypothetical protein